MAGRSPAGSQAGKNGITYTRDFEVMEMSTMGTSKPAADINLPTTYSISAGPMHDGEEPSGNFQRWVDSFRRAPEMPSSDPRHPAHAASGGLMGNSRFYDVRAATARTAHTALARELKGRHLQMIAIGGSIGTGLFVASGVALQRGGPISILLAFMAVGAVQFCTMQALGELVVTFPVAGSFSALATRFLDPSWGFALGWNYALQWVFTLPLEIIAGALTTQYWNDSLSKAIFVTIFLLGIIVINMFGIKGYGEAEFIFSIIKVTAVVGFILLGIVINIGGTPSSGYIGARYWRDPGPFNNGFKGFCSVLVTAAFSFAGTELIGLAAAETANPRKSLPSAIKKVFWRIAVFYIVTLLLVGLLVPYNEPRLLGATSSVDARASPFVIAIESAGATILPSVMNAVILIAVISVGNSAVFGASRTLAALAEQSQAPMILAYVDREGRPLVSILLTCSVGLLAYLVDLEAQSLIFDWLLAISGLSSLFTWASICLCHIRFRAAWKAAGNSLQEIPFRSQTGIIGSWFGFVGYVLVLISQIWLGVSPITSPGETLSPADIAQNFFLGIMALPIVLIFWGAHKIWYRTGAVGTKDMDIDTGRRYSRLQAMSEAELDQRRQWPLWKRVYHFLF